MVVPGIPGGSNIGWIVASRFHIPLAQNDPKLESRVDGAQGLDCQAVSNQQMMDNLTGAFRIPF